MYYEDEHVNYDIEIRFDSKRINQNKFMDRCYSGVVNHTAYELYIYNIQYTIYNDNINIQQ